MQQTCTLRAYMCHNLKISSSFAIEEWIYSLIWLSSSHIAHNTRKQHNSHSHKRRPTPIQALAFAYIQFIYSVVKINTRYSRTEIYTYLGLQQQKVSDCRSFVWFVCRSFCGERHFIKARLESGKKFMSCVKTKKTQQILYVLKKRPIGS